MTHEPLRRASENATEIVSTLVTGLWLAALFTGQDWWLGFMLFGYVVIIPLTSLLFGDDDTEERWDTQRDDQEETTDETDDDALATLRERYARGELTDEQFERKLETLLETETIEDLEEQDRIPERESGTHG